MKIAFLSFYSGQVSRGIETFVHELANCLAKANDVTVFQCGPVLPGAEYGTIFIDTSAQWSRLNELRHLSALLLFDFSLKNLCRRFYLDYWSRKQAVFVWKSLKKIHRETEVVVSVGGGWVSFLTRIWCWLNGKKFVVSGQSGPGWDDRINLMCRPDAFVALTKYQSDWAVKNGFGVRVAKIANGVNLEKFSPKIVSKKIELPGPIFLCVAALEKGKHVDKTIRAVSGLEKGSLVVLGDGGLKKQLVYLASQLLPNRFLLTNVAHDKIPAYYRSCDVVTMLPPRTESFGIVFLEAMACNKPVVTSDDPARREIVGDAGLFVDFENIREYSAALQKALNINWGTKPRKQAEKFSWDKIAQQYEELFESL